MAEEPVAVSGGRCAYPVSDAEFKKAVESVKSKSFADSKLTLARQITKSKCLNSEQVRDMAMCFDFEENKMEYLKYAYDFVLDPDNYYVVNEAFTFEMSIEELQEYLDSK